MTVSGTVTSIEDHGYIISTGIKGTNAFLSKKETEKDLKIGSVIVANVIQRSSKVITLSTLSDRYLSSLISSTSSLEMEGLVAGCQLQAKVSAVTQGGLKLTVLGIFEGSMESSHCKYPTDLEDHYKVGQKVKCRALWVDTASKTIGLTCADHLLTWKSVVCSYDIGDIKTVTVKRVDDKVGLLVDWNEMQLGYVHVIFHLIIDFAN
jgi:rRNA biogenesis protein RRP5